MAVIKRILLVLAGLIVLAGAGALLAVGLGLSYAFGSSGSVTVDTGSIAGKGDALVSDGLQISGGSELQSQLGTITLGARSGDGKPIFLGVAGEEDIFRYLDGVPYDVVTDIRRDSASIRPVPGGQRATPPGEQSFWIQQASGDHPRIDWPADASRKGYRFVVMNADASPGVAAAIDLGFVSEVVYPASLGASVAGVLLAIPGLWLIYRGCRRKRATVNSLAALPPPAGDPVVEPAADPLAQ